MLYRAKLIERGYANVDSIEAECHNILRYLNSDTGDNPVKGLVVGNVQSGKTANMAGLISMAADHGWNLFIVLSGTIESLREQTRARLYDDLQGGEGVHWITINRLKDSNVDYPLRKLDLRDGGPDRYLTVCLKNSDRLTDVLKWINRDTKKKKQLKVLLIDDEADQASVNTAQLNERRKTINRLIVNMVNGENEKGVHKGVYKAMNYVAYTATPYANFLSEGSEESLYPRNFITLLTPSNLYFGPEEIFGSESRPGLSMINTDGDVNDAISSFIDGESKILPESLKDSVCWFICCVAVMRRQGFQKPASMLIHPSQSVEHHDKIARAVSDYLTSERTAVRVRCKTVYDEQTAMLPIERFSEEYPDYGRLDLIRDYPDFSDISSLIDDLINAEPGHIKMDEDSDRVYHEGIHICIDNSRGTALDDDADSFPRLLYPDDNTKNCPAVPAFIVVGGNTMSRGLTLEGLVSTYFVRKTNQGDTLMQMGRWFGYRKNYELLPRIWMSESSKKAFEELVVVDTSLRNFIKDNYNIMTPAEFPPKVKKFPKSAYLKKITSDTKSRASADTDFNFEGTITETTTFNTSADILKKNKICTEEFIKGLGKPKKSEVAEALVWRNVTRDTVFEYLKLMEFSDNLKNFKELDALREWIGKRNDSSHWSVILAGIKEGNPGLWHITDNVSINKIERGATRSYEGKVLIKSLSSSMDRIADVIVADRSADKEFKVLKKDVSSEWPRIRRNYGLESTPALIVYCISKNSNTSSKEKTKLELDEDLVGLTVIIPGKKADSKAEYRQIPPSSIKKVD